MSRVLMLAMAAGTQPTSVSASSVALAARAALERDLRAETSKERPVMKVVRLLKDMQAELQAGLDDDKKVHELLFCWCKTNNQDKTQAIAHGEARSAQLESDMDGAVAKIAELKAKRKATQEEMYADQKALDEAEEQRMKDNKAFHAEETDLLEAIDAAEYAIVALSKHHTGFSQVADRLRKARVTQLLPRSSRLLSHQIEELKGFVDQPTGAASFLAVPGFQSYAPQSGQIFGILEQMKKDFEDSLSGSQKDEAKSQQEFDALKAAKLQEIAMAKKVISETESNIAATEEKHAQALEEYEDTQHQLDLDRQFLADLTNKCANADKEFEQRVKDRQTEIAGVDETIAILNSDDSFDVAEKTVNTPTVFLQEVSAEGQQQKLQRRRAALVLREAASRSGSAQFTMLAASASLDSFTEVKKAIDKMVSELSAQNKDEIEMRDWCIENLNTNKRDTTAAYDKKDSLTANIADMEKTEKTLTDEIAKATEAVAELQRQMKAASEIREGENADYQQTISDQRLMQTILVKALDRMRQVYALMQQRQPGAAHIATSGTATDAGNGPARFTKYEQNAGGGRVVAMLEQIITDSKKADDDAIASEEDAQTAYESFMKSSNEDIIAHQTALTNMNKALAQTREDLLAAKGDFKHTMGVLGELNDLNNDLHKSCDYILKNFDARQAARTAEIGSLKEAKDILSGMN